MQVASHHPTRMEAIFLEEVLWQVFPVAVTCLRAQLLYTECSYLARSLDTLV